MLRGTPATSSSSLLSALGLVLARLEAVLARAVPAGAAGRDSVRRALMIDVDRALSAAVDRRSAPPAARNGGQVANL